MAQNEMVYTLNAYALGKTIFYRPSYGLPVHWEHCTDKPESWDFEKNDYCVVPHIFKAGDKVRTRNGKDIINYTGNWASEMCKCVGKTFTIRKTFTATNGLPACWLMEDAHVWTWDFRGLELVEEA